MNLAELLDMERAGVFKVGVNPTKESAVIAGSKMNDMEIKTRLLPSVGWVSQNKMYGAGYELWELTGSLLRNIGVAFDIEGFNPQCVHVVFERLRGADSLKGYERVTFMGPNRSLIILHGMPGLKGGAYALFDSYKRKDDAKPTKSGSSYKSMREYITEAVIKEGM